MDATTLAFAGAAEQARLIRDGEVSVARGRRGDARAHRGDRPADQRLPRRARRARAGRGRPGRRPPRAPATTRPLLGVPVAIKDDVDVAGEADRLGHRRPRAARSARDAEVVRRLRAAGAIIVGKTLVPEMTMLPGDRHHHLRLGAQPVGPDAHAGRVQRRQRARRWRPGLCGVALGSDGAGSIRDPSAWNGLFGLKPTRDRVPVAPHDDAWQGLSVNGPLARRGRRRGAVPRRDGRRRRRPAGGFAARRGARAGAAADRGEHQGAAGRAAAAGPRGAPGGARTRRRCCAGSATRSSSAIPTTRRRSGRRRWCGSCAASATTSRRRCRTPSGWSRGRGAIAALGGRAARGRSCAGRARPRPSRPRGWPSCGTTSTSC